MLRRSIIKGAVSFLKFPFKGLDIFDYFIRYSCDLREFGDVEALVDEIEGFEVLLHEQLSYLEGRYALGVPCV